MTSRNNYFLNKWFVFLLSDLRLHLIVWALNEERPSDAIRRPHRSRMILKQSPFRRLLFKTAQVNYSTMA